MRRDERALALTPNHQIVGGQRVDGLAHRALRNAEACGQLDLARQRLAGQPSPHFHIPQQQIPELQIQRPEGGSMLGGGSGHRRY
jgi:hypothetical protein